MITRKFVDELGVMAVMEEWPHSQYQIATLILQYFSEASDSERLLIVEALRLMYPDSAFALLDGQLAVREGGQIPAAVKFTAAYIERPGTLPLLFQIAKERHPERRTQFREADELSV